MDGGLAGHQQDLVVGQMIEGLKLAQQFRVDLCVCLGR